MRAQLAAERDIGARAISGGWSDDNEEMREAFESRACTTTLRTDPSAAKAIIDAVQAQDAVDLGAIGETLSVDTPGRWPIAIGLATLCSSASHGGSDCELPISDSPVATGQHRCGGPPLSSCSTARPRAPRGLASPPPCFSGVATARHPPSSLNDNDHPNLAVYFVIDATGLMAAEDYDGDKQRLEGVRADALALVQTPAERPLFNY